MTSTRTGYRSTTRAIGWDVHPQPTNIREHKLSPIDKGFLASGVLCTIAALGERLPKGLRIASAVTGLAAAATTAAVAAWPAINDFFVEISYLEADGD